MNPAGGIEHRMPEQHAGARQLEEAEREVAEARAEVDTLTARIATHEARASRLAAAIGDWIASIPAGVAIEMHRDREARKPAAKQRPTPADVEAVRRQLAENLAGGEQVAASPYPSAECKALVREQVKTLGVRAEPDLLGVIAHLSPVRFKELHRTLPVITGAGAGVVSDTSLDIAGLYCLVHGKDLIAWLEARIDALAEDHIAISSEDRKSREIAILEDALLLERQEEALIDAIEAGGGSFLRRDNADPRAVLGLSSDLPGPSSMY